MKKNQIDFGRRWLLAGTLALFVLYSLNCFVVLPLRNMLSSDILFADNLVIINLVSLLGELIEVAAISFFYAVLLLLIYRCGSKRGALAFIPFAAATVYKYCANTAVSWMYEGSIPSKWAWDIVNVFFYTALELLQLFIVFLFVKGVITLYTEKRDIRLKAARTAGYEGEAIAQDVYPFDRLYDRSNCLLRSAFICALITVIAKEIGSVVSDVWLIVLYGLPEDPITWLFMAVNYISKVILGFAVYFVTVWSMNILNKNTETKI